MILYISNTTIDQENIITVPHVDAAIEKLVTPSVDAVIVSKEITQDEIARLRATAQVLSPDSFIIEEKDSMEMTIHALNEMQRLERLRQYQFNDSLAPENVASDIRIA